MSFYVRYCYYGVILVHMVTSIAAYHFDMNNVILYEDPAKFGSRGSYFGYSVALWNPGNKNLSESRMFIGAPRANSSAFRKVNEPGTVFKCKIGEQCSEWVMNNETMSEQPTHGSWLGGAMNVESNSNPNIVVCASRWLTIDIDDESLLMPGSCYKAAIDISNFVETDSIHLQPLQGTQSYQDKNNYFALGQCGFSIHMIPDPEDSTFVLGCPGVSNGHGTQIQYDSLYNEILSDLEAVDAINANMDYSGYALTSGDYFENGKRMYAIGAPRGEFLSGKVLLFSSLLGSDETRYSEATVLHGDQIGEYFGAALASCDIDGDGKDDLLVGAPQWAKTLDEGQVYIFRGINDLKTPDHYNGEMPHGRFGSAIICLGDVDYDGYADVAVGAPYEGNGAVYIFHGGKNGLTLNPQKISGPEATRGFGISISEPCDVDNNGFADIAVGAYLSGHVTLIRSKRVVTMKVNMSHNIPDEQLNRTAEIFSIRVCSMYGGAHLPRELNVIQELKIDEMYKRAKVDIGGQNWTTYNLRKTLKSDEPESCENFTVKIHKTANFDYLEPLQLFVSQRLDTNEKNGTLVIRPNNVTGYDNFNTSDAVTKGTDKPRVQSSLDVEFRVDCDNNTCRSNLSIEMTTDLKNTTRYVIGSKPHLKLIVKIMNSGDNAYRAKASVLIPILIKISKTPPSCEKYLKNITHIEIICQIGNPLAENKTEAFSIGLDMSAVPANTTQIKFEAVVRTSSEDIGLGNNKPGLVINNVIEADIGISGKTNVDSYSVIRTQEKEQLPDVTFIHTYEIKNDKITPLGGALLSISFPTHWVHADEEIEIVKLNKIECDLDEEKFDCSTMNETSDIRSLSFDAAAMPEWLLGGNSSKLMTQLEKKFTVVHGKVLSAYPDNRTLYFNTTNPSIKWKTIDCKIGPFKTARSTAQVALTFDLLPLSLTTEIIQGKDIIFFATNGSTKITVPDNFIQTTNNKPDVMMIGTMFIGALTEITPESRVAKWVIPVSVSAGVLLLMLVVFGLFKFGFFKRSRKLELEALKKENEDVRPRVVLETTSSTEALNIT